MYEFSFTLSVIINAFCILNYHRFLRIMNGFFAFYAITLLKNARFYVSKIKSEKILFLRISSIILFLKVSHKVILLFDEIIFSFGHE